MDKSKLALKMLAWERLARDLKKLESEIAAAVMEIGKTWTVGNVRATYSKGRGKYDYESAVKKAEIPLEQCVAKPTQIDWAATADMFDITDVDYVPGTPYVKLKLID